MLGKLGGSFFAYALGFGFGRLTTFLLLPLLTRKFSPEEYGIIDLTQTMLAILAIFGMLQIDSAVGRYYSEMARSYKSEIFVSTGFWFVFLLSFLVFGLFFFLSPFISKFFFTHCGYSNLLRTAFIGVPLSNLFNYLALIVRFKEKPLVFVFCTFIQMIISLFASILFVSYLELGVVGVFWGQNVGFFVGFFFFFLFLKGEVRVLWCFETVKNLLSYSLPMVPAVVGGWINNYGSRILLLTFFPIETIGIYSVAIKFGLIFQMFQQAFTMSWVPFFIGRLNDPTHRVLFIKVFKLITVLSLSGAFGLTLLSVDIIPFIIGNSSYDRSFELVGLLWLSHAFITINQVIGIGPVISKKTIYNTINYLFSVIVHLLFLCILCPKFGLIGAPLSFLFSSLTLNLASWIHSERLYYIGYPILWYIVFSFFIMILFFIFYSFEIQNFVRFILFFATLIFTFFIVISCIKSKKEGFIC